LRRSLHKLHNLRHAGLQNLNLGELTAKSTGLPVAVDRTKSRGTRRDQVNATILTEKVNGLYAGHRGILTEAT
jgi:hypothetical protein